VKHWENSTRLTVLHKRRWRPSQTTPLGTQIAYLRWEIHISAVPSGRAVWGIGLRPSACWDRGFGSHRGHACLSFYSICVVRQRSLRQADPLYREVLPTVVCVWVWSNENKQLRHLLWVGRSDTDYETNSHFKTTRFAVKLKSKTWRETKKRGRAATYAWSYVVI
jgi:hypothetical protein